MSEFARGGVPEDLLKLSTAEGSGFWPPAKTARNVRGRTTRSNESEVKSKCYLYTPGIARARNLTERTRPECSADAAPVGVVERVEELSTQCHVGLFPN